MLVLCLMLLVAYYALNQHNWLGLLITVFQSHFYACTTLLLYTNDLRIRKLNLQFVQSIPSISQFFPLPIVLASIIDAKHSLQE